MTYPLTVFSPSLVDNVGDIGTVLGEFLEQQKSSLQIALKKKYPSSDDDLVQRVLNSFITLEGTKRPQKSESISITGISADELKSCLDLLEKSRILRYEDGIYELAHDTLAKRISDDRGASEVAFLEVVKMVHDRENLFQTTRTLLNANELQLLKSVEDRLRSENALSSGEWEYVKKSRNTVKRRRIILWSVIGLIFAVLASSTIFALDQRSTALTKQKEEAEARSEAQENLRKFEEEQQRRTEALYDRHVASGRRYMSESQYDQAIQEFDLALEFNAEGEEALELKRQCEQSVGVKGQFELLIEEGNRLMSLGDDFLVDARNKFRSALNLGFNDVLAQSRLTTVEGRLPVAFDRFVDEGDKFLRVQDCTRAVERYRKALRIRPGDQGLRAKIDGCN